MRIISGIARGTKLFTLEGKTTRPTLDRVKESLFNILQNKIIDAYILDLFAGSGALGLESLSRGAKKAVLCDQSREAIKVIKQNVEKTKMQDKVEIINRDYKKCIEMQQEKFDLIFIDPPYELDIAVKAVDEILKKNLLQDDGLIVLETDREDRELEELKDLRINIFDIRRYGRVKILFIDRKE